MVTNRVVLFGLVLPVASYLAFHFGTALWPCVAAASNNPLVQTIFGSTVLGTVLAAGREMLGVVAKLVLGQLVTRTEVSSVKSSVLFQSIHHMLNTTNTKTSSDFTASLHSAHALQWHERSDIAASKHGLVKLLPKFDFLPAYVVWDGNLVVVSTSKMSDATMVAHVYMWGPRKHDALTAFLQHLVLCHDEAVNKKRKGGTVVYEAKLSTSDRGVISAEWEEVLDIAPRTKESLVLKQGLMDAVLADAKTFFASREKYNAKRQPHRRGYLFHGPPGTGKSSLARVLASEVEVDGVKGVPLYMLQLSDEFLTDTSIAKLLMKVKTPCSVLIEDADCISVTKSRMLMWDTPTTTTAPRKLTLSGVLNALDGAVAGEGRIVIMTTNRQEMLDAALCRPGRIDRQFLLSFITREQVVRLFLYHCGADVGDPAEATVLALRFADLIPRRCITGAYLQMYFMECDEVGRAKVDKLTNRHNVMSFVMRTLQDTHSSRGEEPVFGMETLLYSMLWGYGYERLFPWMIRGCKFHINEMINMGLQSALRCTPDLWYDPRLWHATLYSRTVMPIAREALAELLAEHFPKRGDDLVEQLYASISTAEVPLYTERVRHFVQMNQDDPDELLRAVPSELLNYDMTPQCHQPVTMSVARFLSLIYPGADLFAKELSSMGVCTLFQLRAVMVCTAGDVKLPPVKEGVDGESVQASSISHADVVKALPPYVYDQLKAFFVEVDDRRLRYISKNDFSMRLLYRDELAKLLLTTFPAVEPSAVWRHARRLTDTTGRSNLSQHSWAAAVEAARTFEECFDALQTLSLK